jgi:hypothetical protein
MATYYVFSVNTTKGTTELAELSTWSGPGTRIPGSPAFTTKAAANAWIGANPNAPICAGYFNVPEGEGGKITNTLASFTAGLNPHNYKISTSGVISFFGSLAGDLQTEYNSTVTEIRNTVDTVDNTTTLITTIHVTDCAQIAALTSAGATQYQTSNSASAAAAKQNAGYTGTGAASGSGSSWEQSIQNFIGDLTSQNLWVRVAKIVFGGGILLLGIAKLTGADAKIGGVVAKATKLAPLL